LHDATKKEREEKMRGKKHHNGKNVRGKQTRKYSYRISRNDTEVTETPLTLEEGESAKMKKRQTLPTLQYGSPEMQKNKNK